MSRQDDAAARIAADFNVRCEYAADMMGGQYLVENTRAGSTARDAEKMARKIAAERNAK